MDDYIKRSDALELAREYYTPALREEAVPVKAIKNIPSADVQPVVHGKWLWELADKGWANHICSICGYTKNTDIHVVMDYNFCPNCGAKMDGDGDV